MCQPLCEDPYPWQGLVVCEWYRMNTGFIQRSDIFQPNYIWAELCLLCVCVSSVLSPAGAASSRKGSQTDDSLRLQASSLTQCQTCPSFPFFPPSHQLHGNDKILLHRPISLFFFPHHLPSTSFLSTLMLMWFLQRTRRVSRVIRYLERRKHRFLNKWHCFLWLTEQDCCEECLKARTWQLQLLLFRKGRQGSNERGAEANMFEGNSILIEAVWVGSYQCFRLMRQTRCNLRNKRGISRTL